jgi:hypothetical protein
MAETLVQPKETNLSGLKQRPVINVCHFVLDWDSTLTTSDTLATLAKIGYDAHVRRSSPEKFATLKPWSYFVNAYIVDYKKHQAEYLPRKEDRRTVAEESAWLASLQDVELNSWQRVTDAGIFSALEKGDIENGVEMAFRDRGVKMRQGWESFFNFEDGPYIRSLTEQNSGSGRPDWKFDTTILSVNWSAAFIECCLNTALREKSSHLASTWSLFTNELSDVIKYCPSKTEPELWRPIRTSADKLRVLVDRPWQPQEPKAVYHDGISNTDIAANKTIYLGDSLTDFDCLIAADIGICVRDSPMSTTQTELLDAMQRVGVEVHSIYSVESLPNPKTMGSGPVVWWTDNLGAIPGFILASL